MKRYRLKLIFSGKAGMIQKVIPNAFTFVAWANPETVAKAEFAELVLAQFAIGLVVEETQ